MFRAWLQGLFEPRWNRVALEARIQELQEENRALQVKIQQQVDYILMLCQKPTMERVTRPPQRQPVMQSSHSVREARRAAMKDAFENAPLTADPEMHARAARYKN